MNDSIRFTAAVVTGAGRGKSIGTPTLNLSVADVPPELSHGIYACYVQLDDDNLPAALHYGPPIFYDATPTCEVHILDRMIDESPDLVHVTIVSYLRPIKNFGSEEELKKQIQADIDQTRGILHA